MKTHNHIDETMQIAIAAVRLFETSRALISSYNMSRDELTDIQNFLDNISKEEFTLEMLVNSLSKEVVPALKRRIREQKGQREDARNRRRRVASKLDNAMPLPERFNDKVVLGSTVILVGDSDEAITAALDACIDSAKERCNVLRVVANPVKDTPGLIHVSATNPDSVSLFFHELKYSTVDVLVVDDFALSVPENENAAVIPSINSLFNAINAYGIGVIAGFNKSRIKVTPEEVRGHAIFIDKPKETTDGEASSD